MKRSIITELKAWKDKNYRKPLILKGARQVGKTYILDLFGKEFFIKNGAQYHHIDLRAEKKLHSLFQDTQSPQEILNYIQLSLNKKIDIHRDLLILDEIQECPGAITSLKYFEQDMKSLAVIAAGSHLGLVKNQDAFPVGKVNFLYMFPLTFAEFLQAFDEALFSEYEKIGLNFIQTLPTFLHQKLLEVLRWYFFTGGLPEVVKVFLESFQQDQISAIRGAREVQNELIEGYKSDFVKYSGTVNANHILRVFEAVPAQLSQVYDDGTKKLIFQGMIPNQKGFHRIAGPLEWLVKSRLSIKSFIASKAEQPLLSYCRPNQFKVFLFDIGILNAMLKTEPESILTDGLGNYKGYLAENFVATELFAKTNDHLVSWQEGQSEIEFLIMTGAGVVPLEVKSSSRSRRAKSLNSFVDHYRPKEAYKLTGQNFGIHPKNQIKTLPLYLVSKIF